MVFRGLSRMLDRSELRLRVRRAQALGRTTWGSNLALPLFVCVCGTLRNLADLQCPEPSKWDNNASDTNRRLHGGNVYTVPGTESQTKAAVAVLAA